MEQESLNSINQIKKLIKEDGLEDKALYLRPKQGMENIICVAGNMIGKK